MSDSANTARRGFAIAIAAAAVSTLVRLWLGWKYFGFQTGDDVEIAEEAMRRAIGLRHTPWDVRSLFVPDVLVAPLVRAAHACGVFDPLHLLQVARLPFELLAGVNVVLLFLLGRRWFGERAGAVAAVLYAFHWMPLVYGSSLYPRVVAASCILGAMLLVAGARRDDEEAVADIGVARAAAAGLLAALAITTRYSEAVFFASILAVVLFDSRRRTRNAIALTVAFAAGVALFVGVYDWITWGRPFGSLIAFADLTLVQRDASSRIVNQPFWWYFLYFPRWLAPTAVALMFPAWRHAKAKIAATVVLPLLALSLVFHKELRYLQVIVPFALLFAAYGFTLWWQRAERRIVAVVLLALSVPLGLTGIGIAARRSSNAVRAAEWIAARGARRVALSQAWAYGGQIFVGSNTSVVDPGVPPDRDALSRAAAGADCVAIYASDRDAAADALFAREQLTRRQLFSGESGRAVTVACRASTR